ncbi:MAG: ATP-binding protein [Bacteroidales bacterium]|nr:ATP-binding protein [Bacteroidales bacterium]
MEDTKKQIAELKQQILELKSLLEQTRIDAENANKSKTMFLANMSHEIRTPMNSIIGIYNVLNQTDLSSEQKEFLDIINISSHNLLAIINDILDLSKIEAGQLKLENKPFFLHEEIHQVIKLLSIKAKGKGIDLFSKIQSTVPVCVTGDSNRLKQILINLTNNAIKFTNEGHVELSVETINPDSSNFCQNQKYIRDDFVQKIKENPENVILKFEVVDSGIGISSEEQENLFHEFAQLQNPLIKKFEGSGLGLSISKNLTQLMNGKIGVISEKGKGSTFWFTLLLEKADEEGLLRDQLGKISKPRKIRPLSILLVEDNLLNQKFAMTSLQRAGHNVDLAENGKIAVEKFRNHQFDLILMDIAMPVMDGIEATHVIRELESKTGKRKIKIVAITAHVMVTDRDKCLAAGMDEYISKPYRPQELMAIIEQFDWE